MKIFINDIPVSIIKKPDVIDWDAYHTIKKGHNKMISHLDLIGDILFVDLTGNELMVFLTLVHDEKFARATSVTFAVNNYKKAKKILKKQFSIVNAGGGVVLKDKRILMIYRLKKWDLPKGKADKKETFKQAAKREVEEECEIEVTVQEKLCTTWHTYTKNKRRILKKTVWFMMDCVNDSNMAPQEKEGIEKVAWFDPPEITNNLRKSYPSIMDVFKKLNKQYDFDIKIPKNTVKVNT